MKAALPGGQQPLAQMVTAISMRVTMIAMMDTMVSIEIGLDPHLSRWPICRRPARRSSCRTPHLPRVIERVSPCGEHREMRDKVPHACSRQSRPGRAPSESLLRSEALACVLLSEEKRTSALYGRRAPEL